MKFHRNVRPLRSHFDMAPFAGVMFLLVLFIMLGSMTYKPGVRIELPVADNFPGTDRPSVTIAVDEGGHFYFYSQPFNDADIKTNLVSAAAGSRDPLTLVIQSDKAVSQERLIRLMAIAKEAGINDALYEIQSSGSESPSPKKSTLKP